MGWKKWVIWGYDIPGKLGDFFQNFARTWEKFKDLGKIREFFKINLGNSEIIIIFNLYNWKRDQIMGGVIKKIL